MMQPDENESLLINKEESHERIDLILSKRFAGIYSRTYFQMLIDEEKVLLNGKPIKKRVIPKEGDEVQIQFVLTPEIDLTPEDIPLNILYEDDHIIVINKPAGMVVHPAVGNWTGTFVNALLFHCNQLKQEHPTNSLRPGIVHRLDKDTTGLLIAAKTNDAQKKLITLFSSRDVYKEYLAICLGNPGTLEINEPIGRHPVHRQKMAVQEAGKPSITLCETLAYNHQLSLVKLILATGRTHQIRVHMKHLGCPILGDSLYGNMDANKKFKANRQFLHAYRLKLKHPITGKDLAFEAPIPADMQPFIKLLS